MSWSDRTRMPETKDRKNRAFIIEKQPTLSTNWNDELRIIIHELLVVVKTYAAIFYNVNWRLIFNKSSAILHLANNHDPLGNGETRCAAYSTKRSSSFGKWKVGSVGFGDE